MPDRSFFGTMLLTAALGTTPGSAQAFQHLFIGGENYFLSADGRLMPARKGQSAPDLRYFDQPQ